MNCDLIDTLALGILIGIIFAIPIGYMIGYAICRMTMIKRLDIYRNILKERWNGKQTKS